MLQLRKTLELAKSLLTNAQIDFAFIGGFALGAQGIHRATKDLDLLVDGNHKSLTKKLLSDAGFKSFSLALKAV